MIAALLALGAGCPDSQILGVVRASFAPFEPPAVYRGWWTEVEACSLKSGSFDIVTWMRVDAADDGTFPCGRRRCAGAWQLPHTIYISADHVPSEPVVKHEMVHELIRSGSHLHPAFFACGLEAAHQR